MESKRVFFVAQLAVILMTSGKVEKTPNFRHDFLPPTNFIELFWFW